MESVCGREVIKKGVELMIKNILIEMIPSDISAIHHFIKAVCY